jgi:hypothetical protein
MKKQIVKKKHVLQIVDSIGYVQANCYQHQLLKKLQEHAYIYLVTYDDVISGKSDDLIEQVDQIVSTLKLRTIDRIKGELAKSLKNKSIIMYDQDPFEAFRLDGAYLGAYNRINQVLDVKTYVTTVKIYADYMRSQGMNAKFAYIWMLPEYCNEGKQFVDRKVNAGFMGSLYPWRKSLFEDLSKLNVNVFCDGSHRSHSQYMDELFNYRVFMCSHSSKLKHNDVNLDHDRHGMWHKDIEVAARGCFSISENSHCRSTYVTDEMKSIINFDYVDQIPDILNSIEKLDVEERQQMIKQTVEAIKKEDRWKRTAEIILNG